MAQARQGGTIGRKAMGFGQAKMDNMIGNIEQFHIL